ncbi:preprotein translocase subunit Sec61beta [Candidatus Bathyarchaeota archaeon]|nr:MAG: preprotein translocase subunit Sec61beta [Candidatus Bathyarchaeota archaeon]RLI13409.1 MAG: preprotein translocase subunit Sec61beta [Candidatus Bathyarchaeota archaeon]
MMSKRKRRRERRAPMPATGAGLLRFFEEDTPGIRIRPEMVLILSVVLIIICIVISRWRI